MEGPPKAGASSSSGTHVAGADADTSSSKAESHPVSRLPPQYFQPPDAFDAVHHMLESLPEQLGEAFVQGQIQHTQGVLDLINSQLSARVMRSYGAFVHGMAQVQQLERDLMASAILCRSARRHLGLVQDGMVVGSLHVLSQLKRKANLAQLIDQLGALRSLAEDCVTVQAAVQPHAPAAELPVAALLLVESEANLTKLGKLKQARCIRDCSTYGCRLGT